MTKNVRRGNNFAAHNSAQSTWKQATKTQQMSPELLKLKKNIQLSWAPILTALGYWGIHGNCQNCQNPKPHSLLVNFVLVIDRSEAQNGYDGLARCLMTAVWLRVQKRSHCSHWKINHIKPQVKYLSCPAFYLLKIVKENQSMNTFLLNSLMHKSRVSGVQCRIHSDWTWNWRAALTTFR